MFCTDCGTQVNQNYKFCPGCGSPRPESREADEASLAVAEPPQRQTEAPAPTHDLGQSPRRISALQWIGIGVGSVVGLIIMLAIIVAALDSGSGTDSEEAGGSTTAPKTIVAVPTNTPAPIVDECPTPAEQAYFDATAAIAPVLADAMNSMGESFIEVGDNPLLMFTDDWKLDVALSMAALQISTAEIRGLDAPPTVKLIHADMLALADALDNSISLMTTGIDDLDVASMQAAVGEMNRVNELIVSATARVVAFCP